VTIPHSLRICPASTILSLRPGFLIVARQRGLVDRRTDANWLRTQYRASERRVCGLLGIAVSSYRYRSRRSDESLREKLVRLSREKPRYGYRRLQVLVEREGERVNHKRLWRVYREAGLCLKRKKRRHCVRIGAPRPALTGANQEWALDFAHDVLASSPSIAI
jgi:putative transposase